MPSSLVSWTDHGSVVAAGLRKLYAQRETHADFEIRCMGGQRAFRVHKLVLALFTDFFRDMDGLWARLDVDPELVEILLAFLYVGEAVVDYDKMEDFLQLCLRLRVQLFKDVVPKSIAPKAVPDHNPVTDTANPEAAAKGYSERYELNDFRLLCPRCFKCFQNEKKAKAHKLACLTPANIKCNYCTEMFRFHSNLRDHEASVHSDDRPWVCNYAGCDKTFKIKNSLTEHIKRHHEKITYSCPHCDKVYNYRNQLTDHVKSVHSNVRAYTCGKCGDCYATHTSLNLHVKKVHENDKVRKTPLTGRGGKRPGPKPGGSGGAAAAAALAAKRVKRETAAAVAGIVGQQVAASTTARASPKKAVPANVGQMGWFVIKTD